MASLFLAQSAHTHPVTRANLGEESVGVYLNPNTGRFQTMDTFEGNNQDPQSLHKYLYCHANPVNGWDPSGNEFQLGGLLSAMGNGLRMAAQTGFNGYSAYSRAKWLKEGTELICRSIATGTFDPMAVGLMLADVIPFGKIAGKVGQVPGIKQLLGNFNKLSNAAKGQAGEMVANAVARATCPAVSDPGATADSTGYLGKGTCLSWSKENLGLIRF